MGACRPRGGASTLPASGVVHTLFGALGFVLSVPFLLRLRRRSGSWRRPVAPLLVFAAMFTISTTVIGPAIRGSDDAPARAVTMGLGHAEHH